MKRDEVYRKIIEASRRTGVPTKKILDFLYFLNTEKTIENNELLGMVGVSKNALNQIKSILGFLLNDVSRDTQLNKDFYKETDALFDQSYRSEDELYSSLKVKKNDDAVHLLEKFIDLRPSAKRKYDQFTSSVETTSKRSSLLQFFCDIEGKRILFLGDDDFTSVAVACQGGAEEIVVLDIDERILNGIKSISKQQNFRIITDVYDARSKLPTNYFGEFDVVFTDPPYTTNGVLLFASRGVDALDQSNESSRLYLCYGNSDKAKERFVSVQQKLLDLGLMTRWIFDKFNRYTGAESIGSSSSLFICDVTPKTKSIIKGDYDKSIYTFN